MMESAHIYKHGKYWSKYLFFSSIKYIFTYSISRLFSSHCKLFHSSLLYFKKRKKKLFYSTIISRMFSIISLIFVLYCHSVHALPNNRALSPTVQIPSPEYVKLLNHSILFYEAQRSGKLPADNRVSW